MTQPGPTASIPREIAPDLFCLGPKGRTQTNVYFVRSGATWVLIDAGWEKDALLIERAAEMVFGAGTRPAAILLTHDHPDHAGSARQLARAWDSPVYVHHLELPIAEGDFAAMERYSGPLDRWIVLPMMRMIGRRRRDAILTASSLRGVVRPLDPDGHVPGLRDWRWIHTPGHTPGHASYVRPSDGVAVTGDAIVTLKVNALTGILLGRAGLSGPPRYTSWDWRRAQSSVAALAALEPTVLATGHGEAMTGAGTGRALQMFAAAFAGRSGSG